MHLEDVPKIKRSMIYCWEPTEEATNGVAIMLNRKRFEIIDKLEKPQLLILELRDIIDDERITVVNTYINPTYNRRQPNSQILEDILQAISITIINRKKIIIWGDLNHEIRSQKRIFKNYGLNSSCFEYTRPQSRSELDIISTNYKNPEYSKDLQNFMSDHEWLVWEIRSKWATLKDIPEKKTSRKSLEKLNIEWILNILNTSQTWSEVRMKILD